MNTKSISKKSYLVYVPGIGDIPVKNIDYIGEVKIKNKVDFIGILSEITLSCEPYYQISINGKLIDVFVKDHKFTVEIKRIEHPEYTRHKRAKDVHYSLNGTYEIKSEKEVIKKLSSHEYVYGDNKELDDNINLINKFRDNIVNKVGVAIEHISGRN